MYISALILLVIATHARAGGTPSKTSSAERGIPAKDVVMFTEGGQKYFFQKSFKVIPLLNPRSNPRVSRRNDLPTSWVLEANKPPRGTSGQVGEGYTKPRRPPSPPQVYQTAIRRNDKSKTSEFTPVQKVQSPPGVITVTVPVSPKGKVVVDQATTRRNANSAPGITEEVQLPLSKAVPDAIRDDFPNGNLVNVVQIPLPKKSPEIIYELNPNSIVPAAVNVPQPYDFGYGIDDGFGSSQFRRESSTADGVVTGNYGYKDYQGVFRHVNYVADKDGFRAVMRTNEPSVLPVDSADVSVIVDPPPPFFIIPSEG